METQRKKRQDEEYWREQVERSKSFAGTVDEYCVANGVSKSTLSRYRRLFGAVRKTSRSAFVKIAPIIEATPVKEASSRGRLPDPRWLAELLLGLGGGQG